MPVYTLGEMCSQVRENLLAFSPGDLLLRDGMTGDSGNTPPVKTISITDKINEALSFVALRTGYSAVFDDLNVSSGVREYDISSFGMVLSVYTPIRLRPTTIGLLNSRDHLWRTYSGGAIYAYYMVGVSRMGFIRPPDYDGTVEIYHIAAPARLSASGDTPTNYPPIFGHIPALVAALNIARIDASNPSSPIRVKALGELVEAELDAMKQSLGVLTDESADASRNAEDEVNGG